MNNCYFHLHSLQSYCSTLRLNCFMCEVLHGASGAVFSLPCVTSLIWWNEFLLTNKKEHPCKLSGLRPSSQTLLFTPKQSQGRCGGLVLLQKTLLKGRDGPPSAIREVTMQEKKCPKSTFLANKNTTFRKNENTSKWAEQKGWHAMNFRGDLEFRGAGN